MLEILTHDKICISVPTPNSWGLVCLFSYCKPLQMWFIIQLCGSYNVTGEYPKFNQDLQILGGFCTLVPSPINDHGQFWRVRLQSRLLLTT